MSYTILTQSAAHGGLSKVARAYSQAKQTQGEYKFDLRDGTYLVPSIFYKQGQASATVTCCGVDVTDEYIENAFHWTRDSGNIEADTVWNAAHAGMKSITFAATDIDGDVKISCTLTASSATYGSITVDDDLDASHTPGDLDANDIFVIENGDLKVTTSRGNVYALEDGKVKAAGAKLSGSITAESKLFASQPEDMVEFSYDHNGLRTQKKVTKADGTVETTDYTLHGKLITHLTRGEDEMHFFYDNESRPAMVDFNGALYSYTHNLQGDIVGILDSSGNLVVEYGYDAWGKQPVVESAVAEYAKLASLNPFKYRGYVWDEESGLYYLRTRYYDACSSRFLNADMRIEVRKILKQNLFCYCKNTPIASGDDNGTDVITKLKDFVKSAGKEIIDIIKPFGYKYYAIQAAIEKIEELWNDRYEYIDSFRETYNIPSHVIPEMSRSIKLITPQDKQVDYAAATIFMAIVGGGAGIGGSIISGMLGFVNAKYDSPPSGYYLCITYKFEHEYYVIGSGEYDNHEDMECERYVRTWTVEQFTNGINVFYTVSMEDTNSGAVGIYTDHCPLHS